MKKLVLSVVLGAALTLSLGGGAALAVAPQGPQGQGAPLQSGNNDGAPIFNSSADGNHYLDLCGGTAVSSWADGKSGGHANVGNQDGAGTANTPGGGC